ncbi:hypothetical protein Pla163_34980 [Planctomycetes bacterium Pla163]|uniref:Uncharacterized protein n=1 Tax=Rohdeia mirabilis TaxID=2528008 RepID=A0A518D4D8_9BACT|nr:hypothetical protein Pla163_34980 [Planctomycetes bacterium Pla163]
MRERQRATRGHECPARGPELEGCDSHTTRRADVALDPHWVPSSARRSELGARTAARSTVDDAYRADVRSPLAARRSLFAHRASRGRGARRALGPERRPSFGARRANGRTSDDADRADVRSPVTPRTPRLAKTWRSTRAGPRVAPVARSSAHERPHGRRSATPTARTSARRSPLAARSSLTAPREDVALDARWVAGCARRSEPGARTAARATTPTARTSVHRSLLARRASRRRGARPALGPEWRPSLGARRTNGRTVDGRRRRPRGRPLAARRSPLALRSPRLARTWRSTRAGLRAAPVVRSPARERPHERRR